MVVLLLLLLLWWWCLNDHIDRKMLRLQNSAVVVVADEAISNVRTVRAFSMEEVEMR